MNDLSIIAIQARVSSTRFPQKVLQKICGSSLIEHLIKNLQRTSLAIYLLVPSQEREKFEFLNELVSILSVDCDISDVLTRYVYCARITGAQNIIRVTGDNPATSIDCLLKCLQHHQNNKAHLTTMMGIPYGAGVEVLSKNSIFMMDAYTQNPLQREHVCTFIYENPEKFAIYQLPALKEYQSDLRISVDTKEDLLLYQQRLLQQNADGQTTFLNLKMLIQKEIT